MGAQLEPQRGHYRAVNIIPRRHSRSATVVSIEAPPCGVQQLQVAAGPRSRPAFPDSGPLLKGMLGGSLVAAVTQIYNSRLQLLLYSNVCIVIFQGQTISIKLFYSIHSVRYYRYNRHSFYICKSYMDT